MPPAAAIDFVTAAEAAGLPVFGLDGFLVGRAGIQPLQEYELDVDDAPNPYHATKEFLEQFLDGGRMVEVSVGDEG